MSSDSAKHLPSFRTHLPITAHSLSQFVRTASTVLGDTMPNGLAEPLLAAFSGCTTAVSSALLELFLQPVETKTNDINTNTNRFIADNHTPIVVALHAVFDIAI